MGGALTRMLGRAAAGGGLYGSHVYWRIFLTDNHGDATRIGTYEVEMRATAGGADQCSGGTASASSSGVGAAADAFDNNYTGTVWASTANTNQYLQYQFASAVSVEEILITGYAGGNLSRTVKNGKLQYSDNGSSWTDAFSFVFHAPLIQQQRTFPEASGTGHRMWRLFFTDVDGGNRTLVGELEFRATIGGVDQTAVVAAGDGSTTGRTVTSSIFSGTAEGAFDNSTGLWIGTNPTNEWIGFVFPTPVLVEEIALSHAAGQLTNRMGKNMKLEYSDNTGSSWTTYKTFAAQTAWTNGQTRVLS